MTKEVEYVMLLQKWTGIYMKRALSATSASIPASPGKMLHSMLKNMAPTLYVILQ